MSPVDALRRICTERIAILDGATATVIQGFDLTEADFRGERFRDHPQDLAGNGDLLNLTRPDVVATMHGRYLAAGSDIIETNTFIANRISQADYGTADLVAELNATAVGIARQARADHQARHDRPICIAGSMGPTNRMASMSPDVEDPAARAVDFAGLIAAYREQAAALIGAGVDLLLIETVFDGLNCRAAIAALMELEDELGTIPPLMISVTVADASGRTLAGQTLDAFAISVAHARPFSLGINCSFGADALLPHLEMLARETDALVSCHPNAGLPDPLLPTGYQEGPADTAAALARMADAGLLNLAGGCCGTTDEHIAAIAAALADKPPRRPAAPPPGLRLAGLEACVLRDADAPLLHVGERTNVAGSRRFRRLIAAEDHPAALDIARAQVEGGAQIIDLNFDDGLLDAPACMKRFCRLLAAEPDIARVPAMIDSSDWRAIEQGLANLQGKPIVNSISLEAGEEAFLARGRQLARAGAAMVVMAFDEEGQAATRERKVAVCHRAYRLLTERAGVAPHDIVFDANVLTVGTGIPEHARYAVDFFAAVTEIKATCPGARCSGGISNVSFAFRGNARLREAMHSVFLHHAVAAGLDLAIVNAGSLAIYDDLDPELRERVEDLLLARREDATERMTELASRLSTDDDGEDAARIAAWREEDVDARLAHALAHGITEHLAADLDEAVTHHGSALAVIEGPLMAGMSRVGELFGAGRMFLPQVVKTARVMKRAVEHLGPLLEGDTGGGAERGKVVLATVAGDVHDIGKNIVGVILSCNGYRVVDLGVKVPTERIIAAVEEEEADLVGLSGLITPSLAAMIEVADRLEATGRRLPLLIGGATTSPRHTAIKIAPRYRGPVVRVADASQVARVCGELLGPGADAHTAGLRTTQEGLRRDFAAAGTAPLVPLDEARRAAVVADHDDCPRPRRSGIRNLAAGVDELVPLVDWTPLLHAWGIKGTWPAVSGHPERGDEAVRLQADGLRVLEELATAGLPRPRAVIGLLPARAEGEDIHLATADGERTIHGLRRQRRREPDAPLPALADWVAPSAAAGDHLGLMVATAGEEILSAAVRARTDGDDYRALMIQALADRLAEAMTEHAHRVLRGDWFGEAPDAYTPRELGAGAYRGIRPAIGYPSCPDHSEKRTVWDLLAVEERIGCRLTSTCAIEPGPSTCCLVLGHPDAAYIAIDRIGRDQIEDYAARKGVPVAETEPWLGSLLEG